MTLLDAPKYDEARARRRHTILIAGGVVLAVLFVGWWLVAGRPVDWPLNWNAYILGRATVNRFLDTVEKNDLPKAYGIWIHDENWQQHPARNAAYPYARFQADFGPASSDNEYGVIKSHKIALAWKHGNVLLVAVLINGRKSGALNLDYEPKTHTLNFSPPGEELYLGP